MTDTIEPVKLDEDENTQIARTMVAQARASGLDLVGPDGLLAGLAKQVLELALEEELTDHLGCRPGEREGKSGSNERNGSRSKTVMTEIGPVQIDVPRDREGTFEPAIVKKRQRRLEGVDKLVLSLTARGLTTGEISAHFAEVYGTQVSKDTISRITEKVTAEMAEWQTRPLDVVYPVIFIDAIVVKVRDGAVTNKPFYVVIGVTTRGERDILGILGRGRRGGSEVLLERAHRDQESRRRGRVHRGLRRPQGAAGGDHHRLGADPGADLRDSPDPQHVPLRRPPGLGRRGPRPQADPHRGQRRAGERADGRLRRQVGRQVPGGGQAVAHRLARVRPVPGLRRGDPQDHLHDQRDRESERALPASSPCPGALPERRRGPEVPLLVTRARDSTGRGRARWVIRWKAALTAFAITFDGRINPSNL